MPAWANANVGRLVRPQIMLGGGGNVVAFGSKRGNRCGVSGTDVVCVAAEFWTRDHPLPSVSDCSGTASTHPLDLFWLRSEQGSTAFSCSATPVGLAQGFGTVPDNKVIGMGHTGVLCLVDHVPGQSARTGVACWNPRTNHGFMITSQAMRLW